jgi:hypothetical protein
MRAALEEYGKVLDSPDTWMVNRFVCPTSRMSECFEILEEAEETGTGEKPWIDFAVVGTPLERGATASESLEKDMSTLRPAFQLGDVTTFEVKVPTGDELAGCVGALKKGFNWFDERDVEVYVELPWGAHMSDDMATVAGEIDGIGFKARTGGVRPDQFPDTRTLAGFISEVAGLESTFKFTAGLHQPLRSYDSNISTFQHGFLNVMIASALATIQGASTDLIDEVLSIQDSAQFVFTDKTVEVGDNVLSLKDIDEFWLFFGGFGSCSFKEPIEGLQRLGWV